MQPISILIANRNTLEFLKLCLKSIRDNLGKNHEIMILDDASSDASDAWLRENQSHFGYEYERNNGPERIGIVGAYNKLVQAARHEIVFMIHTDMYFAPGADEETVRYLSPATVCTCTRIEPPLYPGAAHKIVADFGLEPHEFKEREFLQYAKQVTRQSHYTSGIFAPVMCYKEDYLAVGGLDTAFAPQSREDSDLFNRMAIAGYRFRQSWSAFCYHFSGRGSRKKDGVQKDSDEWKATNRKNERNFIRRWRLSVRHDEYLKPLCVATEPISLVALLGDESENMIPFLQNLEMYFDEIIFVTDGPQPKSIAMIDRYNEMEIAAGPTLFHRHKIKVVERSLNGDFASQRNFGQSQCNNHWVLHADLDERFDRNLLESLQDIIRQMRSIDKKVCGFPRFNYLDGVLVNDIPREQWNDRDLAHRDRGQDQAPRNLDPQFRFLERGVQWQGRVHETPQSLSEGREEVMLSTAGVIRHEKSVARQHQQDARYERISPGASLRPKRWEI